MVEILSWDVYHRFQLVDFATNHCIMDIHYNHNTEKALLSIRKWHHHID